MELETDVYRSTPLGLSCIPMRDATGSTEVKANGINDAEVSTSQYPATPVNNITTHKGSHLMRPCLAGTQSLKQQNNQKELTEVVNQDATTNVTQDSSGFGSMSPGAATRSSDILSSFTNTPDPSLNWGTQRISNIRNNTSDSIADYIDKLDESLQTNIPPDRPRYTETNSEAISPKQKIAHLTQGFVDSGRAYSGESDGYLQDTGSAFSLIPGRQSRMLEENLASVARYVEELTGSNNIGPGMTNANRNDKLSSMSVQMSHRSSQPQQPSSRIHLQHLNEQLATLKAERCRQYDVRGCGNQEELLRYLAEQFPDLVMATNNVITNQSADSSNWITNNTDISVSSLSVNGSLHQNRMSGVTTLNNTDVCYKSGGSDDFDRRCQTDMAYINDKGKMDGKIPSQLMGNLSMNKHSLLSSQHQRTSMEPPSQNNTLAALANLLASGQRDVNAQIKANRDVFRQVSMPLTNVPVSMQERLPCLSSTPAHDTSKSVTRPVSDFPRDDVSPISLKQQVPTCSLSEELLRLAAPYQKLLGALENNIDQAANVYRNSASTVAQKSEAAYHWSGRLPARVHRSMAFSRKVFLGGVPWDCTSDDLIMAFSRFGNVTVSWPQQEGHNLTSLRTRTATPKGYCYLIFDHEASVNDLITSCIRDPINGGDYYKISTTKFKAKDVQVIPWVISDSQYTKSGPFRPDSKRTVFIGALHGKITAEALVTIMNDLFGNVVFAALDTDKYKYPIGSGRVAFSSHKSYMRAVTANFVDVRTTEFVKTIQIDPYLEDSLCNSCFNSPGIYFCRAFECFRYFCPACWQLWHNSTGAFYTHKPLRRTFKPVNDRCWSLVSKLQ